LNDNDKSTVQGYVNKNKQVMIVLFRRKRSLSEIIGVAEDNGRYIVEVKMRMFNEKRYNIIYIGCSCIIALMNEKKL